MHRNSANLAGRSRMPHCVLQLWHQAGLRAHCRHRAVAGKMSHVRQQICFDSKYTASEHPDAISWRWLYCACQLINWLHSQNFTPRSVFRVEVYPLFSTSLWKLLPQKPIASLACTHSLFLYQVSSSITALDGELTAWCWWLLWQPGTRGRRGTEGAADLIWRAPWLSAW